MGIRREDIQAMKEIVDVCVGKHLYTYEMQLNAKRPEGDYAAIKCTSSVNPGFDETDIIEVDGKNIFRTRGIRILTFIIVFSRDGDEFVRFDNSFYRPDVKAILKKHGFAAMDKTALDLASLTLETNWEVRHAVSMKFNVLREDLADIDLMSSVIVDGKLTDNDNVITIKVN